MRNISSSVSLCILPTAHIRRFVLLLHWWWCNVMNLSLARLHRWHLHKWPLSCFCHLWSGSDITVQLQNRCCHGWRHKQTVCVTECLCYMNRIVACLSGTDLSASMERAWIELEGIEAIVKTASKAKFFIEFHSSCLEGICSHPKAI